MGPCIGTEKRETYWACGIISFRVPPSTSQQPDKGQVDTEAWGGVGGKGPPVAAPSSFPPPLNHVFFFFIGTIWTKKLALLSPGWQPCLLKSEFHLAWAKPALQGEISCWKPCGCRGNSSCCLRSSVLLPRVIATGRLIHQLHASLHPHSSYPPWSFIQTSTHHH